MTTLAAGIYDWTPKPTTPTVPRLDGPEPVRANPQPGARGEELLVAVQRFPSHEFRGILWDARIESLQIKARHLGGNSLTVSAPATPQVMRTIGDPLAGEVDQFGRQLYHLKRANQIELVVGSTVDGLARSNFVCRDQVVVRNGRVEIGAVGVVGGLTADRIIGAPMRRNFITTNASFEQGTLAGWRLGGDAVADVEAGGVDGSWCAWVTGTPGKAWLERRVLLSDPNERPWGRTAVGGLAYVKLPSGVDIEDYIAVSIAVYSGGVQVYPDPAVGDVGAAVVGGDMKRGSWLSEQFSAFGYIPTPPYSCEVWLRLHAVDETAKIYFDGGAVIRNENASTQDSVDLTRHPAKLFDHAQFDESKSPWGVSVVQGEALGVSEVGTWWDQDAQTMDEALEAVCGRGVDLWDLPGWRVMAAKRRGTVRTDIQINPWDVLGEMTWTLDPGAQRTALRVVSGASTLWGGADIGVVNTSRAGGQVIDVNLQGPTGMTPLQLKAWGLNQLASISALPGLTTYLLRWDLAMRLNVGDTLRLPMRSGAAAHVDWMRITQMTLERERRFVAVTLGTDPELGGT